MALNDHDHEGNMSNNSNGEWNKSSKACYASFLEGDANIMINLITNLNLTT